MRRSAGTAGAAALLVAVLVSGTAQSGGLDYVDCEFDAVGGVLEVTEKESEGSLIRRAGERIAALQPDGDAGFEEVDCGPTAPTVSNTESILYRLTSDGYTQARLSLGGGPLAPGRTDEGPTSEIETTVRPNPAAKLGEAEVMIQGTDAGDDFRVGSLGANAGVNLNAAAEPIEPDVDVTVERPRRVLPSFRTGKGSDTIDLTGGPELTGPLDLRFAVVHPGAGKDLVRSSRTGVYAVGSDGADVIRLSKRFDGVEGGRGKDRISTRRRPDLILPGPGRDVVRAGPGNDEVFGATGGTDLIDCGPGDDRASAGPRDRLRRCERVKRIPEDPQVHFEFD